MRPRGQPEDSTGTSTEHQREVTHRRGQQGKPGTTKAREVQEGEGAAKGKLRREVRANPHSAGSTGWQRTRSGCAPRSRPTSQPKSCRERTRKTREVIEDDPERNFLNSNI